MPLAKSASLATLWTWNMGHLLFVQTIEPWHLETLLLPFSHQFLLLGPVFIVDSWDF